MSTQSLTITNQLPDPSNFGRGQGVGGNTLIWSKSSSAYNYPRHQTPCLFLGNFKETGNYRLNTRDVRISEHFFYMLNRGDELEITLGKKKILETAILMFSPEIVCEIAGYQDNSVEKLLNDLQPFTYEPRIPAIPFEYTKELKVLLIKARNAAFTGILEHEEFLYELTLSLFAQTKKTTERVEIIPAVRNSTREELYRRILMGKAYIHDNFNRPITIAEIANEACLNKFHFLKLFKSLYSITPHQYLIRLKLAKSKELLRDETYSVFEICRLVGFESAGSFTNLFRKHYGSVPSSNRET